MANATARVLPFRVGRYECVQYLGGGMCDVYRASDTQYGRPVVIKMLKEGSPAEMRGRFEREARVSMKIQHENAMVTYDFAEHEGQLYLVLEFLEGESLRSWMGQEHTLEEKIWVALQVARALEHIHTLDIAYRDLKPENIHVGSATKVKLMDFGIARSADWGITEAGMAVGTAPYMAPEQVRGESLTKSVDIYAFGILLFELLTASRPFEGASYEAIFGQVLFSPPNLVPLEERNTPKALADVIRKCLEKDAANRFDTMRPIVTTLQSSISGEFFSTKVLGVTPARRNRSPVSLILLLVLLLAVAVAGVTLYFKSQKPPLKPLAAELQAPSGNMVLIPAGTAVLGPNQVSRTLPDYYIDRTEVSNRAYADYCKQQSGCTPSAGPPDDPVVNVSWDDAQKFAAWARKRLPTEEEWEKAAAGPKGLRFPWGNDPDPKRANVADGPATHKLMPVNSFPEGKSFYGLLNMAGNVWEWTSSRTKPEQGIFDAFLKDPTIQPPISDSEVWYATKGGSFQTNLKDVPMNEQSPIPARLKTDAIGFRCAKDAR